MKLAFYLLHALVRTDFYDSPLKDTSGRTLSECPEGSRRHLKKTCYSWTGAQYKIRPIKLFRRCLFKTCETNYPIKCHIRPDVSCVRKKNNVETMINYLSLVNIHNYLRHFSSRHTLLISTQSL